MLDVFRVIKGIEIENEALNSSAQILQGIGVPGGDGDIQDSAPLGSVYIRTDAESDGLQLYWKYSTSNNSAADWKLSADKSYVDSVAQGISWREPVRVLDDSSYADSSAFPTSTVDGVSLNDQDRVLFTNVSASGESNVWIYNAGGSPSVWTQDTNEESDGDAVFVKEGTYADQQWVYDGSTWVQFATASSTAELGYIRDFIGKSASGNELPTYSSVNVVTQNANLETAIGEIDTAIGDRTYTEDNVVTDGENITSSVDSIDQAIGEIQAQSLESSATNVDASSTITADSLPISEATQSKWMVQVRENTSPTTMRAVEVHALTDGSTVDYTRYSTLKTSSNISGLDVVVDINGSDMRLRITANNNIDYVVKRIGYSSF